MGIDRIEECIERALGEHEQGVTEPPKNYWVDREGTMLRKPRSEFIPATNGQTQPHSAMNIIKYIEDGLMWRLKMPYMNSANLKIGGFAWCGAFAGWCDIRLKEEIRKKVMPSTYRLYEFCLGTPREIPLDQIQRGDIVIVGRAGGKRWGAHVTRALEVHDEYVETIEGNAHGELGDGTWGEGVVIRKRPFKGHESRAESRIMWAWRFLDSDYED